MYDVAIVGGGPAGLMAAQTASTLGLKAVLLERRRDIGTISRACCQQLIMDHDYQGETIRLEHNEIVFTKNRFSVAYSGPQLPVCHKYFISPSGHRVHFVKKDGSPIVVVIDKGRMLSGLLEQCLRHGVHFISGANVTGADDTAHGIELSYVHGGKTENVQARKLIIAEGVNAVLAGKFGLNTGRTRYARALCTMLLVDGMDISDASSLESYMGVAYRSFAPVITGPALGAEGRRYIVLIGTKERRPIQIYKDLCAQSPLAESLSGVRTADVLACTATAYSPLTEPHKGNVLVAGDAAAYVEVEMQGAMACGFRAGHAVAREIEGQNGFADYTRWWQESFEFNGKEFMQVAQGFALVPTYSDFELDYLFSLIENETLPGTYSQYTSPKLLWQAIMQHGDRIEREQPGLFEKIHSRKLSLNDSL